MSTTPHRRWFQFGMATMFVVVAVVACLIPIAQYVGPIGSMFLIGVLLVIAGIAIALQSRSRLPAKSDAQVVGCLVAVLVAVFGGTLIAIAAEIAQAILDD